jgi:hypothetical protein
MYYINESEKELQPKVYDKIVLKAEVNGTLTLTI